MTLEIYNIIGQKVESLIDEKLDAGFHSAEWDGSNVANGIYLYRLKTEEYTDTKKMLLLK